MDLLEYIAQHSQTENLSLFRLIPVVFSYFLCLQAAGVGTYDKTAVKYLRLTNLDDTNFIILQMTDSSSHHWELKLEAGKSLVIGDTGSIDDQADIDNFSASAMAKIIGKADTAACDIEIYIAST